MISKNGNFLTANYEWIAAAVALAALVAGGVMFARSLGVEAEGLEADATAQISRAKPEGGPVQKADLVGFNLVSVKAKNPTSLTAVADDKGSFLASERRMFCEKCQAAVPTDVKACPVCGYERKEEVKVVVDGDGDGMPDAWEKKFGLNPNDPSDATLDKDADGFTNFEEYEAKTDPADKSSHPDYLDSLSVQLPLKETVLPFYFTGTSKTPSGLKFQFKDPSRAREYDRGNYSLFAGEEIGKSGFAPKEFVAKTVERTMGGGMKKKVDASEAIIVRKSDNKTVAMTVNRQGVPVDVQAKLFFARNGGKSFDVVAGDAIDLNGTKYVIREIKRTDKGAAVAVEHATLGKIRILQALEP